MPSVLVISPHLDDVAFSCAEPLRILKLAGWQVDVATVFTATIPSPSGFALACQIDKGIGCEVDYMALRRAEDRDFLRRLELNGHHLDLAEAPHRHYDSAAELFGVVHEHDPAFEDCERVLGRLLEALRPDVCIGPLGVGRHVDHAVVVASLARALSRSHTNAILHYADQPYALKHPQDVDQQVATLDGVSGLRFSSRESTRRDALEAACAYTTQLDFQFGGKAPLCHTLEAIMSDGTRFWQQGPMLNALEPFLVSSSHPAQLVETSCPD